MPEHNERLAPESPVLGAINTHLCFAGYETRQQLEQQVLEEQEAQKLLGQYLAGRPAAPDPEDQPQQTDDREAPGYDSLDVSELADKLVFLEGRSKELSQGAEPVGQYTRSYTREDGRQVTHTAGKQRSTKEVKALSRALNAQTKEVREALHDKLGLKGRRDELQGKPISELARAAAAAELEDGKVNEILMDTIKGVLSEKLSAMEKRIMSDRDSEHNAVRIRNLRRRVEKIKDEESSRLLDLRERQQAAAEPSIDGQHPDIRSAAIHGDVGDIGDGLEGSGHEVHGEPEPDVLSPSTAEDRGDQGSTEHDRGEQEGEPPLLSRASARQEPVGMDDFLSDGNPEEGVLGGRDPALDSDVSAGNVDGIPPSATVYRKKPSLFQRFRQLPYALLAASQVRAANKAEKASGQEQTGRAAKIIAGVGGLAVIGAGSYIGVKTGMFGLIGGHGASASHDLSHALSSTVHHGSAHHHHGVNLIAEVNGKQIHKAHDTIHHLGQHATNAHHGHSQQVHLIAEVNGKQIHSSGMLHAAHRHVAGRAIREVALHPGANPWTVSEHALGLYSHHHLTPHELHRIALYDQHLMHLDHIMNEQQAENLKIGTMLKLPKVKSK